MRYLLAVESARSDLPQEGSGELGLTVCHHHFATDSVAINIV
jgi:hypothetical protein